MKHLWTPYEAVVSVQACARSDHGWTMTVALKGKKINDLRVGIEVR